MECRRVKELLSPYIDRQLEPGEHEPVAAHLETCAKCGAEYEELHKTVDFLRQLPEVDPPSNFSARLRSELANEISGTSLPRGGFAAKTKSRVTRVFLVAAAAVICLAVGLSAIRYGLSVPGINEGKNELVQGAREETTVDQRFSSVNEDSSAQEKEVTFELQETPEEKEAGGVKKINPSKLAEPGKSEVIEPEQSDVAVTGESTEQGGNVQNDVPAKEEPVQEDGLARVMMAPEGKGAGIESTPGTGLVLTFEVRQDETALGKVEDAVQKYGGRVLGTGESALVFTAPPEAMASVIMEVTHSFAPAGVEGINFAAAKEYDKTLSEIASLLKEEKALFTKDDPSDDENRRLVELRESLEQLTYRLAELSRKYKIKKCEVLLYNKLSVKEN